MATANVSKLTPAQRSANFNVMTRQYEQTLASMTFAQGQTITQNLPKARFGQKLILMVDGTFTATHASKTTFTKSTFDKYNIIKQLRINYNSGFNPYQISGSKLFLYNQISNGINDFLDADVFGTTQLGNTVSSGGASNKIKFALECPFTINERDTIGLVNLQNQETNVSMQIDCDNLSAVMTDTDVTLSNINITITPVLRTYSIPAVADAVPDYSIMKLVNEDVRTITGNGDVRFTLQTGLTYRRIMFFVTSDGKTPLPASAISKVQLAFNQADTPYTITGDYLAWKNKVEYQGSLPLGCYVLEFADAGLANYAGARDYVDTESLTQLDLIITFTGLSGNTNTINIIPEKLAKLQ